MLGANDGADESISKVSILLEKFHSFPLRIQPCTALTLDNNAWFENTKHLASVHLQT